MSGYFPPGVTGFEREIAGDPPGRYAIDQWIGPGDPYGRGSWQPMDDTYDYPFSAREEALAEVERMVNEDLVKAWGAWNGGETDIQPDATDFRPLYRVVDLDGRS